jgi:hypothetical protein
VSRARPCTTAAPSCQKLYTIKNGKETEAFVPVWMRTDCSVYDKQSLKKMVRLHYIRSNSEQYLEIMLMARKLRGGGDMVQGRMIAKRYNKSKDKGPVFRIGMKKMERTIHYNWIIRILVDHKWCTHMDTGLEELSKCQLV